MRLFKRLNKLFKKDEPKWEIIGYQKLSDTNKTLVIPNLSRRHIVCTVSGSELWVWGHK